MLVIISDLHLNDGSTGATVPRGAFDIFAQDLRDLAVSASWRSDDCYRPIEGIDLVLLGDVLDVIRSARWQANSNVRPWHNPNSPDLFDVISRITGDVLRHNEQGLGVLRSLASGGAVTLPPANRSGQPTCDAEAQPVSVRIFYMVGNHDWLYHLPGANYNNLRQTLIQHLGLINRHDAPFPHEPAECDELLETMRRHKVFGRHGDIYDPFNFEGDRDSSSLGDAIVIELISRFAAQVDAEMSRELPAATILGLREIDNIRPVVLVPVWIDGLLERTCPSATLRKQVKRVWDRLVDDFLALDFVRSRDTWSPVDLVDGLERMLKFSKRLSVGWAAAIVEWLNRVRGPGDGSYYHHALAEREFRNRRAKHIVYGHTHVAETLPLDASYSEGHVLDQMYFNSGTWRRVHRQTQLAPGQHEFIPSDCMTYLAFFQGDERKGRAFESWTGTLGVDAAEATIYRIDPPEACRVPAPHMASESDIATAVRGPHFAMTPRPAGIIPKRRTLRPIPPLAS